VNEHTKTIVGMLIRAGGFVFAVAAGYWTMAISLESRITALETTVNNARLADIPSSLARIEQKIDNVTREPKK